MRPTLYVLLGVLLVPTVGLVGDVVTDGSFKSTKPSGAPLDVASSTMVANLNADMVDGIDGSDFATEAELSTGGAVTVLWDNLSPRPAGLDDGDDDTLGELSCAADEIAKWSGSDWQCATAGGVSYSRTYLVGPVGDWAANGAALLAAMAAIPDRSGSADIALLKVEPGWYDLGGEQLVIKPYVDVEGAGRAYQTVIRSERCGTDIGDPEAVAVVVGDQFTELRDLVVQNTCADDTKYAVGYFNAHFFAKVERVFATINNALAPEPYGAWAIYSTGDYLDLVDVEAFANGAGLGYGVYSTGDDLVLERVKATGQATGGIMAEGIRSTGYSLRMTQVIAEGYGALSTVGIYGSGRHAQLQNVTVSASNPSETSEGISLEEPLALILDGVVATGGAFGVKLVVNPGSSATSYPVTFRDVTATGGDTGVNAWAGVGSIAATVHNSSVEGVTSSITASGATFKVGASQLSGGAVSGPGFTCAGVWDESYTFYSSTCP